MPMPTSKELLPFVRRNMENLAEMANSLQQELRTLGMAMGEKRALLDNILEEYQDLDKVYSRYATEDDEPAPQLVNPGDARPGPTQWIGDFIVKSWIGNVPVTRDLLTTELRNALGRREVASSSSDHGKLASSLVGNLIKRGRLVVRADGTVDDVDLPSGLRAQGSTGG